MCYHKLPRSQVRLGEGLEDWIEETSRHGGRKLQGRLNPSRRDSGGGVVRRGSSAA